MVLGGSATSDFLNSQSLGQKAEGWWAQILLSILDGLNTLFKRTDPVGDHRGKDFKRTNWREEQVLYFVLGERRHLW